MSTATDIQLPIEVDVLTGGSIAEIVNSILELLLYQRGQIPLVYKMYKFYVTKWTEDSEKNEQTANENVTNYQLEHQKEIAMQTKNAISRMRRIITDTFEENSVRRLRFLFGSTPYMPKEVYNISIPSTAISRQHSHAQHPLSMARLNQALMSLLTHKDLFSTFSTNLAPTNLYFDVEIMEGSADAKACKASLYPKEFVELPAKCKQVNFILSHVKPKMKEESLLCCKDLQVYQDFCRLSLAASITKDSANAQQVEEKTAAIERAYFGWWESDIYVHGFKDKPIKGESIWTK